MTYNTVKRLDKSRKDPKETNMTMSNFTQGNSLALGFLIAKLTVGSRTTNMVFFYGGYKVRVCYITKQRVDTCQPMCAIDPS